MFRTETRGTRRRLLLTLHPLRASVRNNKEWHLGNSVVVPLQALCLSSFSNLLLFRYHNDAVFCNGKAAVQVAGQVVTNRRVRWNLYVLVDNRPTNL